MRRARRDKNVSVAVSPEDSARQVLRRTLHRYPKDAVEQSRLNLAEDAWREHSAEIAEHAAAIADDIASIMEAAAQRGDEQRLLRVARTERQMSSILRQDATKLRDSGDGSAD